MDKRFDNIPLDTETAILARVQMELDKYIAVYEISTWSGFKMSSIILLASDVKELTNKEIEDMVRNSIYYEEGKITMSRKDSNEYVFCNFNFIAPEVEEDDGSFF